jgi:hypothetical protein
MKNLLLILFILTISVTAQEKLRTIPNNSFKTGEYLKFNVDYGFITVGEAEIDIPNTKTFFDRQAHRVRFRVKSKPFFDTFFKVRDRYETFIDSAGIFPWRFEQHVREGKYSKDYSAFFNQNKGIATSPKGEFKINQYTHDIVSAFFYIRASDFSKAKKGSEIHLENFFADKTFPLDVVYHGKERVKVDAGTFDCIIVEPLVADGGLFKSEGRILIWLTDDQAHMPVKVNTEILIGSIDAELVYYKNVKNLKAKR